MYFAVGSDVQWERLVRERLFSPLASPERTTNEGRRKGRVQLHEDIGRRARRPRRSLHTRARLRHQQRPLVTTHRASFRFVAVYNHELSRWHCYVTNLPVSIMKPEHFPAVYAARWEVELLFRELKGTYRIEHMPSANKHVTETLIYAALLTLAVSRKLHRALTRRFALDPTKLPFDRWAVLVASLAHELLDLALARRDRRYRERRIERLLRAEATDPNRARTYLAHKSQHGIYQRA